MILELVLAALFTTRGTAFTVPAPAAQPVPVIFGGAELADLIRMEIEAISGPGSVDVSINHETLFSVRIAVPSFRSEICNPIYDRELQLYRVFPELNFDFYLWLKPDPPSRP